MTRRVTGRIAWLAVLVTTMLVSGCSLNPGQMASSVRSSGGGAELTLQFDDTLNLPEGADVTLNGTKVGSVTAVDLRDRYVDVATKLKSGVQIPSAATASIRQNTVLGDPYVAVNTTGASASGGPMLRSGAVIPLAQTTSPPPLEDTLAVVSTFINGGSIQNMQDVIRKINAALPEAKQTQRVARIAAIDLRDLSKQTSLLDQMLTGLDRTATTVARRNKQIQLMLNPEGMHYWSQLSKLFSGIGIVLPSIGSVFEGGYWLMPLLTEVDGSIGTVRGGLEAVGANLPQIQWFLSKNLFPFMRKPGLEIVSASTPEGREVMNDATKLLRMLGAIR